MGEKRGGPLLRHHQTAGRPGPLPRGDHLRPQPPRARAAPPVVAAERGPSYLLVPQGGEAYDVWQAQETASEPPEAGAWGEIPQLHKGGLCQDPPAPRIRWAGQGKAHIPDGEGQGCMKHWA